MKIYSQKSSAIRAAKKEFGEGYLEKCSIKGSNEDGWIIETEKVISIDPVEQLLAENQADIDQAAIKKAEIESRKPIHTPKLPFNIPVAEKTAPAPIPSLPPALKIEPRAELPVPKDELPEASAAELAHLFGIGDKLADSQIIKESDDQKTVSRPRFSSCERPTKKVWHIADNMPGAKRQEVIDECMRQGIAYGTSRTQYQHWFKCKKDSESTPIAIIDKDGKITMPGKE